MGALWQDIRFGLRMLGKRPGFTAVAALTLALGIGANTAIFSLTDQILLRPLPVPEPEQLVVLRSEGPITGRMSSDGDVFSSFSYPMYKGLRESAEGSGDAVSLLARFPVSLNVSVDGQAERVSGELVSGNYFEVLQVQPALGRLFTLRDEPTPGAEPVAVLSHAFWMRRFGGDPGILNRTLVINATVITVVGVAPPAFYGVQLGDGTDVFLPITLKPLMTPNWDGLDKWNDYWLAILGRLAPGTSREQGQAALTVAYRPLLEQQLANMRTGWSEEIRQRFLNKTIELQPGAGGRPILQREAGTPLLLLMGMVGLVLLIACVNVANLLIARGLARQREIAVRLAMGASRWRLVRQLLAESLLLAGLAGVAGALVAKWTLDALLASLTEQMGVAGLTAALDARVLGFNFLLAAATGLIFGLLPALRSTRADLVTALKDQGAGTTAGVPHARSRRVLVAAQIAMTVLLLAFAGLFARSFYELKQHDLGLAPERLLTFTVAPELSGYSPERTLQFTERLWESLATLPGARSASAAVVPVLAQSTTTSNFTVEGHTPAEGEELQAVQNWIAPTYFQTMGIPLRAGREFTRQDGADTPRVAIVNETFARRFFPDGQAVGRRFGFGAGSAVQLDITIVGVVADSKHARVQEETRPFVYQPYTQLGTLGRITFYVRTVAEPQAAVSAAREAVRRLDAHLPIYQLRTLEEQIDRILYGERLLTALSVGFALLAATLAALGIAGVMAYMVARRTREFGIRMALGARAADIYRIVLREVALLAAAGALVGVPAAYYLGRFAESLLFGIQPGDPLTLAAAAALMALVAFLSGYLPARRAARIDPVRALRYE